MPEPKSRRMEDKPEFLETFENCNQNLRSLFIQVRDAVLAQCEGTDYGYTNKTDFRFSLPRTEIRQWETYAELVLKPRKNNLLCNIRIDGMNIVNL